MMNISHYLTMHLVVAGAYIGPLMHRHCRDEETDLKG